EAKGIDFLNRPGSWCRRRFAGWPLRFWLAGIILYWFGRRAREQCRFRAGCCRALPDQANRFRRFFRRSVLYSQEILCLTPCFAIELGNLGGITPRLEMRSDKRSYSQ